MPGTTDVEATLGLPDVLRLVGEDVEVPGPGRRQRYVDLDCAASTPALRAAREAVEALLPWYSSVHRGCGYKSQVATAALDGARDAVADFVGARPDDDVVFVRNTTEAINLVARGLPPRSRILTTPFEHHANLLPWHAHAYEVLPFAASPTELVEQTREALSRAAGSIRLVAVTAASNVTGEVAPVAEIVAVSHEYGARVLVDAAQYVPHRPLDLRRLDADFLVFSGHKLYAPYGAGVLVAPHVALCELAPLLRGGGAVRYVTLSGSVLSDPPARLEAGSPNVLGAVALGAACDALGALGMDRLAARERALAETLFAGLRAIPGLRLLRAWPDGSCDVLGVASFVLDGLSPRLVAAALAWEHGIGVRCGSFCAHPLLARLLDLRQDEVDGIAADLAAGRRHRIPGAVRASMGLATTAAHVDRLLSALSALAADGTRVEYVFDEVENEYRAAGERPSWPDLPFRLRTPATGSSR
jgi:selenocysteine lyase/cysteine desulfurase